MDVGSNRGLGSTHRSRFDGGKCGRGIEAFNYGFVCRTRLVMGLLLIVAVPIFIGLANKAVRENGEAIRQEFGQ